MKKALVIFNPTAGITAKQNIKDEIVRKLSSLDYESDFLYLDPDFERQAEFYNWDKVRLVVAVGGDGTVKVAARTIIEKNLLVPLAIVPFGSANVLAATLKVPFSVNESLKLIGRGQTAKIDVGRIDGKKYFLVGFSIGYVSNVVIHTNKELKNRFGVLGYAIRLFWNKFRIPRLKFRIETPEKVFWIKGNSLIVFNAFNFYGFQAKKLISVTDGILNLFVVTNRTFISMIEAAFGVLFYDHPPKHIFNLDNKQFKITLRHRRYLKTCQIDGDYIKLNKDITIEVLSQAIEVIKPV